MSTVQFPNSSAGRLAKLRDALRTVDTSTMTTAEVAEMCQQALPDCTIDEMATALRHVGAEHMKEADDLRRFQEGRQRGKEDTFLEDFLP